MVTIAAVLATCILIALGIFQGLLIAGYPLGNYAFGGAHKVLPRNFRIGSFIAIITYIFMISVYLAKGFNLPFYSPEKLSAYLWILGIYFVLGVFMNGISRSKPERLVMTPIVFTLLILTIIVWMG